MPFYYKLDNTQHADRRTAGKLLELKEGIKAAKIPPRTSEATLLLATWNLREFGNSKFGLRTNEPIYYIAEIISNFDLVAVQEVKADLSSLDTLVSNLGKWWKYIITDVTEGSSGNDERMAFLYDSRKISFGGLAGEIIFPPNKKEVSNQLARTPFLVGFQAGWFRFSICVTHIYYGKGVPIDDRRKWEIDMLANYLAERTRDKYAWSKNMIMLGDFNIFNVNDVTFEAITKAGFTVPEKLTKIPGSNVAKNKHYDQIAFITPDQKELELCAAGVFDFYEYVYKIEDLEEYKHNFIKPDIDQAKIVSKYKAWRTFQMSDHLPMWIELQIDFGKEYLERKSKVAITG